MSKILIEVVGREERKRDREREREREKEMGRVGLIRSGHGGCR